MTDYARVVVIGGGSMGASVIYHLAHQGWNDCVLIEKAQLTSGATWHAAGLVSRMVSSHSLGRLNDYAVDLYKTIEKETGICVSWHGCGSLRVATSIDHMDWIKHLYDTITARGQRVEIISADRFSELNPLYDTESAGILGALYTPDDGHVDPAGACQAMARGARQLGARIMLRNRVTGVKRLPSGEWCVDTEYGQMRCEHVVNSGGYHARRIGEFSGLELPITTLLHNYFITEDMPDLVKMAHEIPVTRDDYFYGYLRREQQSILVGLYDKDSPKAVWEDGCPWQSENELFQADLETQAPWLEKCFQRLPALKRLGIKKIINGGITYTPDGAMLLGPAPGLPNYWLACGAIAGIAWGPGAGRTLAQWMVHGSAEVSTRAYDPRRFGNWVTSGYTQARAAEDYSIRHTMPYPQHQRRAMRNIKQSGAHQNTAASGATFEEAGGWERPRVYVAEPLAWRRSAVHKQLANECRSVRERAALGDFSAFAKFEIYGDEAQAFLDHVCTNRVPINHGSICLTLLLNERGTIEGEATVARLANNRFYLVTGAPSQRRIWDWLSLQQQCTQNVEMTDRTDELGVLALAGPKTRHVLTALTGSDLSCRQFPWLTVRKIMVAGIAVRMLRISFTGELAFELHAPNERLDELWDALWQAGQRYDIGVFGSKATDSLRLEKFYRGVHELTNDVTPVQTGMMRFVKMDKSFVGKQALPKYPAFNQCHLLEIQNTTTECLTGEAVFVDGRLAGSITSAAFGHAVQQSLAIAFIRQEELNTASTIEVSLFGERVGARLLQTIPYDPQNLRVRA